MANKYDGATIEVINWEKYNPRTDAKRPAWFRVDNRIATGPGFYGLDCEQRWLWIFLLCLVSQANGEPIVWNSAYAGGLTGVSEKKQDETLEIFEKFVRLRVVRKVTSTTSHATQQNTTEQDITKYSCAAPEQSSGRNAVEYPEELSEPARVKALLVEFNVRPGATKAWLDAYPDSEWIKSELFRAIAWIEVNPKKRPKSFARFFGSWLSRGWERRRKALPSSGSEINTTPIQLPLEKAV